MNHIQAAKILQAFPVGVVAEEHGGQELRLFRRKVFLGNFSSEIPKASPQPIHFFCEGVAFRKYFLFRRAQGSVDAVGQAVVKAVEAAGVSWPLRLHTAPPHFHHRAQVRIRLGKNPYLLKRAHVQFVIILLGGRNHASGGNPLVGSIRPMEGRCGKDKDEEGRQGIEGVGLLSPQKQGEGCEDQNRGSKRKGQPLR